MLNKQIGIRLTPRHYALVREVAKRRGEDVSVFVRRSLLRELAVLSYLSEDEKKALGVLTK